MKKFMFLLVFMAGFILCTEALAALQSPTGPGGGDNVIGDGNNGNSGNNDNGGNTSTPANPSEDISSSDGVTKRGVFTPSEASAAVQDNDKNSVTINF